MTRRGAASDWLRNTRVAERGLLFPADPTKAATLLACPEGVELSMGGGLARFSWDDHRLENVAPSETVATHRTAQLDPPPAGWRIWPWSAPPKRSMVGVALGMWDPRALLAATTTPERFRLGPVAEFLRVPKVGRAIALYKPLAAREAVGRDRDTVAALCAVLAAYPHVRPRLADPRVASALIGSILRGAVRGRPQPIGVRPTSRRIYAAMTDLGYLHPLLGRPLPGAPLPPSTDTIEAVRAQLAATGHPEDPADIAKLVDKAYLHVDPWPFHPLLT